MGWEGFLFLNFLKLTENLFKVYTTAFVYFPPQNFFKNKNLTMQPLVQMTCIKRTCEVFFWPTSIK